MTNQVNNRRPMAPQRASPRNQPENQPENQDHPMEETGPKTYEEILRQETARNRARRGKLGRDSYLTFDA